MDRRLHHLRHDASNHAFTAKTYATTTTRDADTAWHKAANLHKVVFITDISAFHVLMSVGPAVWQAVGTVGAVPVTATAAELNYLDLTALGTGAASKAVVVDASGDYIWPAGIVTHETATDALILGSGASGAHHALGVTAGSALEFRFTGTNTTGDMRGMYLRMNFEGSGGSGEAARIYAVLNNVQGAVAGTINGAHITLDVLGASGSISGAGNALRATIGMNAAFAGAGTMSGILIDTAIDTAATLTSVNLAAIRLGNADTKKWPIFVAFDGTVGSGEAIEAATSNMATTATTHAIRVTIDGVDGYIPVFAAKTW